MVVVVGTPSTFSGLSLSPGAVVGGTSSTGTVNLSGPAPAGGIVINLSSSNAVASIPVSVTVAQGATSSTFTITTSAVSAAVPATITGSLGSTAKTAVLTVNPAAISSLSFSPGTVIGGSSAMCTVTLTALAGPAGDVVNLTSSSSIAQVPASVTVPAGTTSVSFTVPTSAVSSNGSATIKGTLGTSQQSASLTILTATISAISVSPATVTGGTGSTGTVTLSGPAGPGGTLVGLNSSSSYATVPAGVTVMAGATSATFAVTTTAVSAVIPAIITGTTGGISQTDILTINPAGLASVALVPTSIVGGNPSTGTVTLNGPAATGGAIVSLSSGSTSATVPLTVTVPAGQTSATFNVATSGVSASTSVIITGTLNGTPQKATLTITPATLASCYLNFRVLLGGNSNQGFVTLNGQAGPGGTVISLSSNSLIATVPSTVTVPAGSTTASFGVPTIPVAANITVAISAALGTTIQIGSFDVVAAVLNAFVIAPAVVNGGNSSIGTLTLSGAAAPGGTVVNLTSNTKGVIVRATVTIPAGQTSATFTVFTPVVTTAVTAIITATQQSQKLTQSLGINPITVLSVNFGGALNIYGSQVVTGQVKLTGPAPSTGIIVSLSSSSSSLSVPSSVTVASGQTSAMFTATSKFVTVLTPVTVTAKVGSTSVTAPLNIYSIQVASFTCAPSAISGGQTTTCKVVLTSGALLGGVVVKLSSNSSVVQIPTSVTILDDSGAVTFTVSTTGVNTETTATLTATVSGSSKTATLYVYPPGIENVSLTPNPMIGGLPATATITLAGVAPSGGNVIKLSSSISAAKVPATVTVPAGKSTVTFTITTSAVSLLTSGYLTASNSQTSTSGQFYIQPYGVTDLTLSPDTVVGGSPSTGTVTLSALAPTGGTTVELFSVGSAKVAPSVTVAAGSKTATFAIQTLPVSQLGSNAIIQAGLNGSTQQAILLIMPPSLVSLILNPTSVEGGLTSQATLTISSPAPAGGLSLTPVWDKTLGNVGGIVVPAGQTSVTFPYTTFPITSKTTTNLSVTFGSITKTVTLMITP